MAGRRDRAQSLSGISVWLSPCGSSSLRPPESQADSGLDRVRLEVAASLPLLGSASPSCSSSSSALHRKSRGSVFPSPASPGPAATPPCTAAPSAEDKQDVGTTSSRDDDSYSGRSNNTEEQFLVGEDQMYPTLRSKSLSENPRKTKKNERKETLQSSASVKDLLSAFRGATEVLVQDGAQSL